MEREGSKASTTSHSHTHAADVEMREIRENSAKRQRKKEEKDKRWCKRFFCNSSKCQHQISQILIT